ncbi:hypothetical protein COCCADRAFT_40150 [Bipolaris zeicola 26-R-13]|uniref:Uncharacterized protein n=1 Tax=Cochliobolus carbonum (strain 26-R-13) TaxID=930089 RepID=W6Y304_COCC2|nr:uncharacterized protein COCCADRAFT_40150 [Bipolaris zeicola 26-R-13]EUC29464.1 hypothetical protein COCCADRAFT_40150 [Bipolaris zeicola 26-R-13]
MKLFITLPLAFTALVISTPTGTNNRFDLSKVQGALEARQTVVLRPGNEVGPGLVPAPPAAQPVCTCPKILGRCIVDATCGSPSFYVEFNIDRYI